MTGKVPEQLVYGKGLKDLGRPSQTRITFKQHLKGTIYIPPSGIEKLLWVLFCKDTLRNYDSFHETA